MTGAVVASVSVSTRGHSDIRVGYRRTDCSAGVVRGSNGERDPNAELRIAHRSLAGHSQALPSPPRRIIRTSVGRRGYSSVPGLPDRHEAEKQGGVSAAQRGDPTLPPGE